MSTESGDSPTNPPDRPAEPAKPARPVFDVRDLLGDGREAIIVHQGEHYRLRVTANDKLILTK